MDAVTYDELVADALERRFEGWDFSGRVDLVGHGFTVAESAEEFPGVTFADVGAVVLYLRMAPWHIDGFAPAAYDARLRALHERIRTEGGFDAYAHRFYLAAHRQ